MCNNRLQDLKPLFYKECLSIYMRLKDIYKQKRGPKFKLSLIKQILITLFKLKCNLPDRVLECLFKIDHVTISRCILRISQAISSLNIKVALSRVYIVDTTTLRVGKNKTSHTYSGYKHHHGFKYQCIINDAKEIVSISEGLESSIHDKRIFESEYSTVFKSLQTDSIILGDKAYVGLKHFNVVTPSKQNERFYKENKTNAKYFNKRLSSKRIQIEHTFAWLKTYRILSNVYYYTKPKLDMFVKAICNIYNLS